MPGKRRSILILFAHPALQKSRINRRLIAGLREFDGVTFHDLYEEYSDFLIDVPREQELLRQHDVIIWQHPFFWYSAPALLKEWKDLVLQHGFAYGNKGTVLRGKIALNAITTGGPAELYAPGQITTRQFLAPYEQTALLCGMTYLPPFAVHGALRINPVCDLDCHAEDYRRLLSALRDDELDLAAAAPLHRINDNLAALISHAAR
jgi:glutathione-regulated potassium-efflux system ancillary protein KefG